MRSVDTTQDTGVLSRRFVHSLLPIAVAYVVAQTAFFMLGKLVELDETKKIFMNPKQKLTEDYITGRFG